LVVCGSCTRTACVRRALNFLFFHASSVSMAFIGPNVFCFRSIFTSFSMRHWTSPRECFSFHLIPLRVMHSCPPIVLISTFLTVHFPSILALIPFYSAHCGDPVPLYDDASRYPCALSGACDHRARDVVGRKREEHEVLFRIASCGILVHLHPSPPAATRLSMLSLCSRSWSWLLQRGSPRSGGCTERMRISPRGVSCLLIVTL
jgi:hypothetical protein